MNDTLIKFKRHASRASYHYADDSGKDLWSTFNVAQENLIKGGFVNTITRRRARDITNIARNIDLNSRLWQKTSEFELSVN